MLAIPQFRSFQTIVLAAVAASRLAGQMPVREPMDEYQVKAGFVTNFASFVEWPQDAFRGPRDPLSICVLGENPFGTSLETLTVGRIVEGRVLAVRQIPDARQTSGCHILFVSSSEHLRLRAILQSLEEQSIFSIGDTTDFISEGGVANLQIESGRVRIEINAEATRSKHLKVSSRLLQLAKNVKR